MKAYKVEMLIIDFEELESDGIKDVIEHTRYPDRCIRPTVMQIEERDIGEWDDDHPLNDIYECEKAYLELFNK